MQTGMNLPSGQQFVPVVTASLGSPIVNDPQAAGGLTCGSTYTSYLSNLDLNPPGIAAKTMIGYYAHAKSVIVTLECGVNSYVAGQTAAQTYTSITSLVGAIKSDCTAAGTNCIVFVATITERCQMIGTGNTTFRGPLNTAIRGGAVANGYTVVDYAADPDIGCDGCSQNATYFQTDECVSPPGGVHLIAAGVAIKAGIMEAAMASAGFP